MKHSIDDVRHYISNDLFIESEELEKLKLYTQQKLF